METDINFLSIRKWDLKHGCGTAPGNLVITLHSGFIFCPNVKPASISMSFANFKLQSELYGVPFITQCVPKGHLWLVSTFKTVEKPEIDLTEVKARTRIRGQWTFCASVSLA